MSDKILGQMLEELQKSGDLQEELYKIKRMFGWELGKEGFVEHMQKWQDAQPITDMSIIEKLDEIWNEADDLSCQCSSVEDDVSGAVSAIEDVYVPNDEANQLQHSINDLIKEIKNPKEQAEADMEDAE